LRPLVVIPTYNEKDNIEEITHTLLGVHGDLEVLVVDDGSPDGTGAIVDRMCKADHRVHAIHRPGKMGLGSAYITAFKYALERDYDPIFQMDSDFSHDPKYLPDFLEKIKDHDLVLGSRYVVGVNVVNWPLGRLLLSYYANMYTRVITRMPIRDATGGFKCFRRKVLESIDLDRIHSEGYSFQIEMSYKTWKKGFRICETPIIFVDRRAGESKMSMKIAREAAWVVWKLRILALLREL
jgi:dolichol-phosphate mannosyltransferase